jgi:hypothetical protein
LAPTRGVCAGALSVARKRAAGAGGGALPTVPGCVVVETCLAACLVLPQPAATATHARTTAIRNRIQRMLDPEALLQPKCVPDLQPKCVPDGEPFPVVVEVGVDVVVSVPARDSLRPVGFRNSVREVAEAVAG